MRPQTPGQIKMPFPPHQIKVVKRIRMVPPAARAKAIQEAGYNTFLLRSKDVIIDLLTDSGTNAMYDVQRAAMELGDEAYAGSESFFRLEKVVKELYGAAHVVPTHQGRAAERIASEILIKPGQYVLSNMYFTTSRAHAEKRGAIWIDVSAREAHDPQSEHPFKGNIDCEKLEQKIMEFGAANIAFIRQEACLNMAGGQPFSMANLRAVKEIAKRHRIPFLIDATRAIENCYFIRVREDGYQRRSIRAILHEMCHDADWIVVSAKKDAIVHIGGLLCVREPAQFEQAGDLLVLDEGFLHYGGMAGHDMEALAVGLKCAVDFRYIEHRIAQVRYFGELLLAAGVPCVVPIGGHGVYIDAKRFLPHVAQHQYPAQALAAAIYVTCGVRGMERGLASAGRDPKTGKEHMPELELVRLTVPRLVYTESHFAWAAEGIVSTLRNRNAIRGLRMVYEPPFLRFFRARFKPF